VVYDDPANLFVAGFMGSPPMNFIPCRVEGAGSGLGVVLESNGRRTVCPVDGAQAALRPWLGKDITMGLRPEKITARPELLAAPFLAATVELTEPTGPDTLVLIRVNGTDVTCRVLPQHARRHGEAMDLAFDVSKAVFFEPGTERRLA